MIIKIFFFFLVLCINSAVAYIPVTTDSRIKTLVYSPTEVFKLKFHHNYQAYMQFPKKEKLEIISLGDPYSWDLKQVGSRLFIKPKQAGILTNMTIITNKRPYHFEIYSSKKPLSQTDASLVYVAKFYYPEVAYDFMQTVKIKKPLKEYNTRPVNKDPIIAPPPSPLPDTAAKNKAAPVQKIQKSPGTSKIQNKKSGIYNYEYSMVGPEIAITPTKIYDDGINTHFEFSGNILPDIFYVNKDGSETPAKYTVQNNIVTVKNISWQFSLRDNQNVICIFNESKLNY